MLTAYATVFLVPEGTHHIPICRFSRKDHDDDVKRLSRSGWDVKYQGQADFRDIESYNDMTKQVWKLSLGARPPQTELDLEKLAKFFNL